MESIERISLVSVNEPTVSVAVQSELREALNDIYLSTLSWRLWVYMAIAETKRRYRRTLIGPFWTTLNLAIFISCMGFLLSSLWKQNMSEFLPYFCSGFICWSLIASLFTEGCNTFITAEGLMKQLPLPYTIFSYFTVAKNYIVFFHHLIILIGVVLIFHVPINFNTLLLIPGLLLVFITGLWITMFLGLICAKYRDIMQIVNSALQLSMFVTPIFWKPGQMGRRGLLIADINPLYHFVDIIRSPLIGQAPGINSYLIVGGISIIGWIITVRFFTNNYRKLIFWL